MVSRLQRRASTPVHSVDSSDAGQGLGSDVTAQMCKRVSTLALVAAGLWIISMLMNALVAPALGHIAIMEALWPIPGLPIAVTGLVFSLLLAVVARRLSHRPQLLLDLSSGFLVLSCLLAALATQWVPPGVTPRVSWLCIIILMYPAIVPMRPGRTLAVSLLAASMDPLALWMTHLRGVLVDGSGYYLLWSFVPTYLSASIAVIPAQVIRQLGQQVRRARELGSYRLEEVLGKGGMGQVYRASHQMLARPAAVKVIRPEVLGQSSLDGARVLVERFRREAVAAASLQSPHTIDLYDFGVARDGTFFLVMELLQGVDLQTLVERFGPQSAERTVHLLIQVCQSLEEAHSHGLIHRDIKPSNIFACRMGLEVDFVKVLDFGLVKAQGARTTGDPMLTAPDATAGTPAYLAPETLLGGDSVDHRVDIYAVGCVAYWLLTGRLVFEAPNALQLLFHHAERAPLPPSQRIELPIPQELDAVILACLAKNPLDRPQSAAELAQRLAATVQDDGWTQAVAQRWWQRHRPESVQPARGQASGMTLSKAVDEELHMNWTETSVSETSSA